MVILKTVWRHAIAGLGVVEVEVQEPDAAGAVLTLEETLVELVAVGLQAALRPQPVEEPEPTP